MNTKLLHTISIILFAVATFLFFYSGTLNALILISALLVEIAAWIVLYIADNKKSESSN